MNTFDFSLIRGLRITVLEIWSSPGSRCTLCKTRWPAGGDTSALALCGVVNDDHDDSEEVLVTCCASCTELYGSERTVGP